MQYICYKRFRGKTLSREHANIPYSTEYETSGDFLCDNYGKPMMATTSYNCHRHFSRNDDGQGLRRGKLAYSIAFAPRVRKHSNGRIFRFSEDEIEMLTKDYSKFLKPTEMLLFNHEFFNASIEELEKLASALAIKIPERR